MIIEMGGSYARIGDSWYEKWDISYRGDILIFQGDRIKKGFRVFEDLTDETELELIEDRFIQTRETRTWYGKKYTQRYVPHGILYWYKKREHVVIETNTWEVRTYEV